MPYESGMDPIHDARRRFAVRFHLVAIAFLVFDVELLFLYPWAVATSQGSGFRVQESAVTADRQMSVRDIGTTPSLQPSPQGRGSVRGIDMAVANGWIESRGLVFGGAMVFILLVVLGFAYDWRKGIFKWR
jgi:NADH-quinone oxidoreductase subunit A